MFYKVKFQQKLPLEDFIKAEDEVSKILRQNSIGVTDFIVEDYELQDMKPNSEDLPRSVKETKGLIHFQKAGRYSDLLQKFKQLIIEGYEKQSVAVTETLISDEPLLLPDANWFEIP